jgi:hypothetical protein
MPKRFKDALAVWEGGASNALAVANALADAIREVRAEGNPLKEDPACKLLADQLCHLLGLPNPLVDVPFADVYRMTDECHARVAEKVAEHA